MWPHYIQLLLISQHLRIQSKQQHLLFINDKQTLTSLGVNFSLKSNQNTFSTPPLLHTMYRVSLPALLYFSAGMNKYILFTGGNNSCSLSQHMQSLYLLIYFQKNPQITTLLLQEKKSMPNGIREETAKLTIKYIFVNIDIILTHL